MEYTVDEISPVERKVNVTIPVEEVNAAISATIAIYKTTADFKGFRKGKVPTKMVEARFKHQIYEEATTDLINYQINEILGELKLVPLSRLDVDAEVLVRDEEFVYSVGFEVAPEIKLPAYDNLEVEQEKPAIDPAEVDSVVDRIRTNLAEEVKVEEDRTAAAGDIVIITFNAWDDGKAIDEIKASNFRMVLGEGQSLADFEGIITKLKAGEKGEGEVSFPEDFINKDFAGKTVTMRVVLHEIKKQILPEIDNDFALKAGGFRDVEQLREAIENSYMESRKNLVKAAAQKNMMDSLLEKMDFPLPPAMVEEHINRMVQEFAQRVEQQGRRLESLGKTPEEIREDHRAPAETTVRTQLLLLAIAASEGLEVSRDEVEQHIQQEAIRSQQDPEAVKRFYEDNNLMFALKDRMLCDKAVELVYARAKITEVEPQFSGLTKGKAPAKKTEDKSDDGLVMTKGGTPFKTEAAAKTRLNALETEGEIVEVEGGFAIKPTV
ncbi:MAG: trigger factor [Proteobacteria bacterium]|nr:trigger factor [Pseudomonadota bacterium]